MHTAAAKFNAANPSNDARIGYWRFEEAVGATSFVNSFQLRGSEPLNGAPVGSVQAGVSGLMANPNPGRAVRLTGGTVDIPDVGAGTALELNVMSVGAWFMPDTDLVPVAAMLWAKFDELAGTAAANSGYLGTAGVYSGGYFLNQVGAVPGVSGTSVRFDGINGIATFPHHVDQRLNGSFTIAFWASLKTFTPSFPGIMGKGNHSTVDGYGITRGSGDTNMFFDRNGQPTSLIPPTGFNPYIFHHYAFVHDKVAQTSKWYLDGVLNATQTAITYPTNNGTANLEVGRMDSGSPGDNWIDDFLIYPNALTQVQVQDAMSGFPIHVPSGNWFGGISRTNVWGIGWQSFSNGVTFDIWIGGARHICEVSNYPLLRGQRYFIEANYNGGQQQLSINGVLVATNSPGGGGNIDDGAGVPMKVGDFHGGLWRGTVDEVFLFGAAVGNAGAGYTALELYQAGTTFEQVPYCTPTPTRERERIIYIRPDIAGTKKYLLHAPPSRSVMSEEGFGTPPLEYVTDRAPFQHGESVRSFNLRPRVIQLAIMQNFRNREDYWNGRAQLTEMLRPVALQAGTHTSGVLGGIPMVVPSLSPNRRGKLLCYLGNGKKRQIDVLLESGPGFAPPQGGWREWSFTEVLRFIAHDPTWYDPTERILSLEATGTSDIVFPITFPITFSGSGASGAAVYLGDWPSAPVIIAWGQFSQVKVENLSTGKQVTLIANIAGTHGAVFDFYNKTVTRSDGVNLLGYVTDDSDLTDFLLQPDPIVPGGINNIALTLEGYIPFNRPHFVSWRDRFMAI